MEEAAWVDGYVDSVVPEGTRGSKAGVPGSESGS